MEPTDFIFSAVLFAATIAFVFYAIPHFIPQPSKEPVESQINEVLDSVTRDIDVQTVVIKADCNSEEYDCNYVYPVEIDINSSYVNMLSQYFTIVGNKMYSIGTIGQENKVFLFPTQQLTTDYNTQSLSLSLSQIEGGYRVTNNYLQADVFPRSATIDFTDSSTTDLLMSYDDINLSVISNTKTLIKLGDENNEFYFYFFPNSPEFWLDAPDDYNIEIKPAQLMWRSDVNTGSLSEAQWYTESGNTSWHYRIPITVNSLSCSRSNTVVQEDINFVKVKQLLNAVQSSVDTDSFRLVEYSKGSAIDSSVPFSVQFNQSTDQAVLTWQLTGTTNANTVREYMLYFDFTDYPKTTASFSSLTYSTLSCPVFISQAQPQSQSTVVSTVTSQVILHNPNTIAIETESDTTPEWDYDQYEYRIPFTFDSGKQTRTDQNVSTSIDFDEEFANVGCSQCTLNESSVRLVEVNNLEEGSVISVLSSQQYSLNYNATTHIGNLSWIVSGTTQPRTKRYYYLYFDNA